jgi:hypothetical protein
LGFLKINLFRCNLFGYHAVSNQVPRVAHGGDRPVKRQPKKQARHGNDKYTKKLNPADASNIRWAWARLAEKKVGLCELNAVERLEE